MAARVQLDCQHCGACCCNPKANRDAGFIDYVKVERGDAILRKPDLLRRFAVENDKGVSHLKLDPSGRCLALRGAVGRDVTCAIYHYRPSPCRRVQADSDLCHRYRHDYGLEA